jgi:hypothetical protein
VRTLVLLVMLSLSSGAIAGPLRNVDWCNRGYGPVGPQLVKCEAAVEQRHRAGEGIWGIDDYRFLYASYGDLTGDGHEDALIVMSERLHPVVLEPKPTTSTRGRLYLIELRGKDLYIYTSESTDTPPTSVAIDHRAATLEWRDGKRRCTETWTFAGEGEVASKSARVCK